MAFRPSGVRLMSCGPNSSGALISGTCPLDLDFPFSVSSCFACFFTLCLEFFFFPSFFPTSFLLRLAPKRLNANFRLPVPAFFTPRTIVGWTRQRLIPSSLASTLPDSSESFTLKKPCPLSGSVPRLIMANQETSLQHAVLGQKWSSTKCMLEIRDLKLHTWETICVKNKTLKHSTKCMFHFLLYLLGVLHVMYPDFIVLSHSFIFFWIHFYLTPFLYNMYFHKIMLTKWCETIPINPSASEVHSSVSNMQTKASTRTTHAFDRLEHCQSTLLSSCSNALCSRYFNLGGLKFLGCVYICII